MNLQELQLAVEQWAEDRNLIRGSTPHKQLLKTIAEFGELADAIAKNDLDDIKDGIGDTVVTLIIVAKQLGVKLELGAAGLWSRWPDVHTGMSSALYGLSHLFGLATTPQMVNTKSRKLVSTVYNLAGLALLYQTDIRECLELAYHEIKDRKGRMVNGTFVKEADL